MLSRVSLTWRKLGREMIDVNATTYLTGQSKIVRQRCLLTCRMRQSLPAVMTLRFHDYPGYLHRVRLHTYLGIDISIVNTKSWQVTRHRSIHPYDLSSGRTCFFRAFPMLSPRFLHVLWHARHGPLNSGGYLAGFRVEHLARFPDLVW